MTLATNKINGDTIEAAEWNEAATAANKVTDSTLVAANVSDFDTEVSNNTDVAANTTHRTSDGKNHSDVVLNNTHRASDGKDHSDVVLNNTHRTSNGSDHTYIDQDVTSGSNPTFGTPIITNVDYVIANGDLDALGNLGTTETITWSNASYFSGTLDNNVTISYASATTGQKITLLLAYDGTAQRTITWPTTKWLGGSAPTAPSATGEILVVTVIYDGTNYIGSGEIAS